MNKNATIQSSHNYFEYLLLTYGMLSINVSFFGLVAFEKLRVFIDCTGSEWDSIEHYSNDYDDDDNGKSLLPAAVISISSFSESASLAY